MESQSPHLSQGRRLARSSADPVNRSGDASCGADLYRFKIGFLKQLDRDLSPQFTLLTRAGGQSRDRRRNAAQSDDVYWSKPCQILANEDSFAQRPAKSVRQVLTGQSL